LKKLTIHIVEDEVTIAMDMEDMLNELGHSVVDVSKSYEEVMRKLPDDESDMFLVDITLRGDKSAIEIADALRSNNIPHVFVSSKDDREKLEKLKQNQPTDQRDKPVNLNELSTVLPRATKL